MSNYRERQLDRVIQSITNEVNQLTLVIGNGTFRTHYLNITLEEAKQIKNLLSNKGN